ncbi:hypothetical protein ACFFIO_04495 [Citricoccus parietis]|uniref:Uncharacterized protein n=1 Tax=Citricoccus parietis TaxID=592307 RepID=A0ABV6F2L0_9MICC
MLVLLLTVILGAGAFLWWIAIVAYRGQYLQWLFFVPVGTPFGFHWALAPMAIAGTGVLLTGAYVTYVVTLPNPEARSGALDITFLAMLVLMFLSAIMLSHRLPRAWKPAWYREWDDRGRPEAEIREIIAARKNPKGHRHDGGA